jgi:hypothetical protein
MRKTVLTIPELALVVGTRVGAGLGLGLILVDHLPATVRRPVGWTLVLVGLPSTGVRPGHGQAGRLPAMVVQPPERAVQQTRQLLRPFSSLR